MLRVTAECSVSSPAIRYWIPLTRSTTSRMDLQRTDHPLEVVLDGGGSVADLVGGQQGLRATSLTSPATIVRFCCPPRRAQPRPWR